MSKPHRQPNIHETTNKRPLLLSSPPPADNPSTGGQLRFDRKWSNIGTHNTHTHIGTLWAPMAFAQFGKLVASSPLAIHVLLTAFNTKMISIHFCWTLLEQKKIVFPPFQWNRCPACRSFDIHLAFLSTTFSESILPGLLSFSNLSARHRAHAANFHAHMHTHNQYKSILQKPKHNQQ